MVLGISFQNRWKLDERINGLEMQQVFQPLNSIIITNCNLCKVRASSRRLELLARCFNVRWTTLQMTHRAGTTTVPVPHCVTPGVQRNVLDEFVLFPDAHGPSYGGVWGLKPLGFEGPRAVWSVWVGYI